MLLFHKARLKQWKCNFVVAKVAVVCPFSNQKKCCVVTLRWFKKLATAGSEHECLCVGFSVII